MNKLKNIIEGWWYWFQSPPRIKAKAAERMKICRICPHKKGAFCGVCGCVLMAKTSSPDEVCPELRWGKMK